MTVGENIKRLREERGITQAELACDVGVTQAMLCFIERGTRNPSLQVARDIAWAMNCTVNDLLEGVPGYAGTQ